MASAGARAYMGSGAEPPARFQKVELPVGVRGAKPPEDESSVAFEALAEELNLAL